MKPEHVKILQAGYAAQQQGDLEFAVGAYREVLRVDSRNEFALNLLGVIELQKKRYSFACELLEAAASVNPSDVETQNNLGLAYSGLHAFAKATDAFRRSLAGKPEQPSTLNNLGNALAAQDKHTDAIDAFAAALALDPDYSDCLHNLAVSLLALGRNKDALIAISRAIALKSHCSHFLNTHAEVLLREARYLEAKQCCEEAISMDGNLPSRIKLSTALKQLGDFAAAESALGNALRQEPTHAEAHHHLGVLHEQLGRSREAAAAYRRAIEYNPRHASAYYQLAKLNAERLSATEKVQVRELLEDPDLLDVFRSSLYFALGCEAEKDKNYTASMAFFKEAQKLKAARHPYYGARVEAYGQACRQFFPASNAEPETEKPQPLPVFIVGMPRSGTTLTEQVLSSHSAITGAGEVGFINELIDIASNKTERPFPSCMPLLGPELLEELRSVYFERMHSRCGDASIVIDKNPLNFNFIGFIATVFPDARIIYCKRHPIDNCVSIFRLPFDDNQGYSHDLAALGHFYRAHEKLMAFWLRCYPHHILSVSYEDMVQSLDSETRRMLDFLDLRFEQEVLRFFENSRPVLTPSTEQVRRPLYTSSVSMWKRYESAISPLIESLGRTVVDAALLNVTDLTARSTKES